MIEKTMATKIGYSITELTERLPMCDSLIRRKIRKGEIAAKKIGKTVVVLHEDLLAFLEKQPDWAPQNKKNNNEV